MSAIELMAKLGANPSMRGNLSDMEIEKLYAFEGEMASCQMMNTQAQMSPDDDEDDGQSKES